MMAIDWLIKQLIPKDQHEGIADIIKEAKEMEKDQIKSAYQDGRSNQQSKEGKFYNRNAEWWFKEQFKENKK